MMKSNFMLSRACVSALAIVAPVPCAHAQAAARQAYDLPAQDVGASLRAVAARSGRNIIAAADLLGNRRAPALRGSFTAEEAVARLLAGSGLAFRLVQSDIVIVRDPAPVRQDAAADAGGGDIVVTGSRIRGEASASPVVVISAKQMREAGQADLGDVARTLPQSFGGGQNPEIGIGVTGPNQNLNAASSLNLRGLGADATLTLLNGHRLSYDGAAQGVDISSIPLAAVDRIEIVPDGASALYGSDAVGGVANVILKRDYDGLDTSARIDVPTDGGGVRQLYTATAGAIWDSGGGLVSADIDHSEPIVASDRDITRSLAPTTTLVREQSHRGIVASLHQRLVPAITFEIDALYSSRRSFGETPYTATGTTSDYGNTNATNTKSFVVAPRLVIDAIPAWQVTLGGLYGEDRLHYETLGYSSGAVFAQYSGCICNQLASADVDAEGPLFDLPGGPARLAIGGGVRRASSHYTQNAGAPDYERGRTTSFGYGELALPFVSARNAGAGFHQLLLDLAGRYERYSRTGVLSPKLGLVYAPVAGLDLKATWGKSFKAPTLDQQFSPSTFTVLNATDLGYSGQPAGSAVAILSGGNPDLQPERARTWSATLAAHPDRWPGAHLELSYFDVDFEDRVQVPIQSLFGALGNPIYASFITYAPSPAAVDAVLSEATAGLSNQLGRPFDPSQVVAIIDATNRNVTREHARGIDLAAGYRIDLGTRRALDLSIDASYLTSDRKIIPSLPEIPLAGTLFNPPRLRGRAGATWSTPGLTLAGFVNYTGGVDDRRSATVASIHGQTTVDLSARFALPKPGLLGGTEFSLSVRNVFDALPAPIATDFVYATPYDSTNYSAVGRVVGLQVSRQW